MTRQPLWVICVISQRKGEEDTEDLVEEMKEKDRDEKGTGMKVNRNKTISPPLTCYKDSRPCLTVRQYQLDIPVT